MSRIPFVASVALFALCLAGLARGQAAADPASYPEQSTPKGALKFFSTSIRAADAKKLRAAMHAQTPTEEKMADATAQLATALAKLRLVAVEKYGEAGGEVFPGSVPTEEDIKRIDAAAEKIDGDNAVVDLGGADADSPAAKMKLVKVGDAWKISVAHMVAGQKPEKLEKDLSKMNTTMRVVVETTDEISAGKHKTEKEALAALQAKMQAAFPQPKAPGKPAK